MIGEDEETWLRVAAITQVAIDRYAKHGRGQLETVRLETVGTAKARARLGSDGPYALREVKPRQQLHELGAWLIDALWSVEDIRHWVAVKHSAWRLGLGPDDDPDACVYRVAQYTDEFMSTRKRKGAYHVGKPNHRGPCRP